MPNDDTNDIESTTAPADSGSVETGAGRPDRSDDAAEVPASMDRRDYLKASLAAAAAAGLGGAASGTAAAETADTAKTVDERIQEHRTGDLEVVVENPDGSAVSGAEVSVSQQEHEFGFGTAVNADRLVDQSSEGDNYREYIPELFNTAVLGNHHKWRFWENNRQTADEATNWLLDQGLDMRGHVCLWGREDVAAIPSDIQTAIEERDAETIRERSMAHIEEIITHYGDDITDWDVVNEAMHVYQLQLGVYGDQIDTEEPWNGEVVPWTSQLLADWYDEAASVIDENDLDVGIAVNDFNQFPYSYTDNRYESQIDHINENGAQVDTVGLQAHIAAREGEFDTNSDPDGRIDVDQVVSEINTWADHGARVKITEFDTYNGDDWNSDEERADVTENYLRGAFSHPGVDAFVVWGFWDGDHWENEAPLFYQDWSQKPAYDVWTGLVYDEWWTDDSGTTDDSGAYATSAFLGDHEITVGTDSAETTETVSVSDASGTTTVTVTVEGDGGGTGDTQPPSVPEALSVSATTDSTVTVTWDDASDNGSSGLDGYVVSVNGGRDQTVGAGMTTATVEELSAGSSYEIGVAAVDGAGNVSAAATVTATTAARDDGDTDAPSVPANLSVTTATTATVEVSWDVSTDSGGSGLDRYAVSVDGSEAESVDADTTSTTVEGLSADTSYEIAVTAVDGAGNESDAATVAATTAAADGGDGETPADALVVDDYDGDPGWASHRNDLGQWCGAGSFENGGGAVEDGALVLEYDNGGWFQEQINQSIEEYSTLVFEVSGTNGGEESEVLFDMGGVRTMLADVTDDVVGTSTSAVRVDMESAGIDRSVGGLSVRLNFWQGGSSVLTIEEIRLE
ncbi:endo-1,4-beta-xylanase [Halosimplex litoreum]|uniref:endo-1,4-beta-xylanase n=1 Tax=Halosimplex litoreum TaxID=1198301 RepID=A0A7T3G170_9EURY|nr:endo-1,4-beta-xylanase [Halosimplex litoreum]QPV64252.1 endo-1,4-beta-xylanase [Halosimplex litoreum]